VSTVAKVSEILASALERGIQGSFFWHGGSAADAQHIAAGLGRFAFDGAPWLHWHFQLILVYYCHGNDYGYVEFLPALEALHALGTSPLAFDQWHSPNVVLALSVAKRYGAAPVALTGGLVAISSRTRITAFVSHRKEHRGYRNAILIGHIISGGGGEIFMRGPYFLDRDGVINRKPEGVQYVPLGRNAFLPSVPEAIALLSKRAFCV